MKIELCGTEGTTSKTRSRNIMKLKELDIGNCIYNVCLSILEKHTYHIHFVHMLPKNICGFLCKVAYYSKTRNISVIRIYAERISTNFNFEVYSEYFGNGRSLSIGRCNVNIVNEELNVR